MALVLGARVVLISPDGSRLRYVIHLHFLASNNAVEYEALINRLRIAIELGATRLYIHGNSELVVNQVMKESSCKSPLSTQKFLSHVEDTRATRKGPLDGAGDLLSFSTGVVDPAHSS
jgi:ribonuclease HI